MYDGKLFHHTIRCPFSTVTLSLLFPMHPSIVSSSSHALKHGFSVSPLVYASIFLPESPQKLHRYPLWNTPDIFLRKSLHVSQAADSRKVYSDHTLYPGVLPASRFQMHSLPAYEVLPEPSLPSQNLSCRMQLFNTVSDVEKPPAALHTRLPLHR